MNDKFLSYITQEKLFLSGDRILLAVSGGLDSMTMLNLFMESNIEFGVAHVNHHLRAEESNEDAVFIRDYCSFRSIPYFEKSLSKQDFSKGNMHQISRALRYSFFEKICKEGSYKFVATAHHMEDSVETFMINLIRGSGIDGLGGIDVKNSNVIRPILFASKAEIEKYAEDKNISFREDSSNAEDKYLRNKIRHHLIPLFHEIDERSKTGILKTINHINSSKTLLESLVNKTKTKFLSVELGVIVVDLLKLKEFDASIQLLYYVIKTYGFNQAQCEDILTEIHHSGATYLSPTHEGLINRNQLLIKPIRTEILNHEFKLIHEVPISIQMENKTIDIHKIEKNIDFTFQDGCQYLDFDLMQFPLTIRKWTDGDKIASLGMGGKYQKVKDILINNKLSNFQKEEVLVLVSKAEVLCIIGMKISEKAKLSSNTKKVLKLNVTHPSQNSMK